MLSGRRHSREDQMDPARRAELLHRAQEAVLARAHQALAGPPSPIAQDEAPTAVLADGRSDFATSSDTT